jgi:hypothetical protein
VNDAKRVCSYTRLMNEAAKRMLVAAVALSALAAVLVSSAQGRIPEGTGTEVMSQTVVAPVVVPYLSQGIGVDPSLFAGRTRTRRLAPRVFLRAGAPAVPATGNHVFVWPTHGTATYQRAARMALHGDPEAQGFVSGQSDINPFDAQ